MVECAALHPYNATEGKTAMRFLVLVLCFLLSALQAHAAELPYSHDPRTWKQVSIPNLSDREARIHFFSRANWSLCTWRVILHNSQPYAELDNGEPSTAVARPQFAPKAGRFRRAVAFAAVNDGWLVGFNQGEFGGALYWFNKDGTRNYKVSDNEIVGFFSLPSGLYAIEGIAHLSLSEGSVIQITQTQKGEKWHSLTAAKMPFAPEAVATLRSGTALVTTSDSLVSVGKDYKVKTLLADTWWGTLYPNSSVLTQDEHTLYIGMRQYVAAVNLSTGKLRFLVPSKAWMNTETPN